MGGGRSDGCGAEVVSGGGGDGGAEVTGWGGGEVPELSRWW